MYLSIQSKYEQEIISERTKPEGVSQVKVVEETNVKRTYGKPRRKQRRSRAKILAGGLQLHHQWQQLQQEYQAVLQQARRLKTRLISKLQKCLMSIFHLKQVIKDKFTKLAEDLQLANQRVLSLREEFRGMRQN